MEKWSRPRPAKVSETDGGWARWSAPGDLKPGVAMDRRHTVSVTLQDAAIDLDEMLWILRRALAHFELEVARDDRGRTVLALTVVANDLWLAVLTAMNAVTATGYPPVALTAEPVGSEEADRGG
ncbi:MAG TPA: hypothetical protein VIT65_26735 [Microlunatus sp.]